MVPERIRRPALFGSASESLTIARDHGKREGQAFGSIKTVRSENQRWHKKRHRTRMPRRLSRPGENLPKSGHTFWDYVGAARRSQSHNLRQPRRHLSCEGHVIGRLTPSTVDVKQRYSLDDLEHRVLGRACVIFAVEFECNDRCRVGRSLSEIVHGSSKKSFRPSTV